MNLPNNILNLNYEVIADNRKCVLNGVINALGKNETWTKGEISRKLERFKNKGRDNKYQPYCGIVIWFLSKRLRSIRS